MGDVVYLEGARESGKKAPWALDTIEALEYALQEARAGRAIGVAIILYLSPQLFTLDAAGRALVDPTFSRGAVAALDDHFASMLARRR